MRRSMGQAVERLGGNVRIAYKLLQYLESIPLYCYPFPSGTEFLQNGVGASGYTCAVNMLTGKLESCAALQLASANKLHWLGTFVSGLDYLSRQVAMSQTDAISLCCVFLFINDLEATVSVMRSGALKRNWNRRPKRPAGALVALLHELYVRNTGVSRGLSGSSRFQAFASRWRETSMSALDRVTLAMKRRCDLSRSLDHQHATDAMIVKQNHNVMFELATAFSGSVVMNGASSSSRGSKPKAGISHQHVVHALAAVGLLAPVRLLDHADISETNSNAKKIDYNGDFGTLRDNVLLWFQKKLPDFRMTPALMENMFCEAHRRQIPKDLFFPGQFVIQLETSDCGERYLSKMEPRVDDDGTLRMEGTRYSGPRLVVNCGPRDVINSSPDTVPLNNFDFPPSRIKYIRLHAGNMSQADLRDVKLHLLCRKEWSAIMSTIQSIPQVGQILNHPNKRNKTYFPEAVLNEEARVPILAAKKDLEVAFPDLLGLPASTSTEQQMPPQRPPPRAPQPRRSMLSKNAVQVDPPPQPRGLRDTNVQPQQALARELFPKIRGSLTGCLSDWGSDNVGRGCRTINFVGGTRRQYPWPEHLHLIQDDKFGSFSGTKDLANTFCYEVESTLKDQAMSALNSNRPRGTKLTWRKTDRWYEMVELGTGLFSAEFLPAITSQKYTAVDVCLLCDAIAACFQGRKLACTNRWAFPEKGTALDYLYAATIATSGTPQYYHNLCRTMRQRYCQRVRACTQMANSNTPRREVKLAERDDGYFVTNWRTKAGMCPRMCLIGRIEGLGKDSAKKNFCLAFPDRTYFDQLKRGEKPRGDGAAVYVRPLEQDQAVPDSER